LVQALSDTFTVHVLERRGRGNCKADGLQYGIDREVEDIQALAAKTNAEYLYAIPKLKLLKRL
jgi:hypothetical protein